MEKTLVIENEEGLHARPAGIFVKKANEFQSNVFIRSQDTQVSGKSIMNILTLGLEKNSEITLITDGVDAEAAMTALCHLIESKFEH